ncbi:MAG: DNA-directed RNA polymerase subunit B [Nitrospiraceae bacterium]|nr:DNA-directed RNA polymerase subunit B [Nitrospiraceae bacterium]
MSDVFLNGRFVGNVSNPVDFVNKLREQRRSNKINYDINFYYDEDSDDVYVESQRGRVIRPLIVVKDGKPLLTSDHLKKLMKGELNWNDLVKKGIVEYLDALEEESAYVAYDEDHLTQEHTHLEIAPFDMLGLVVSIVPFSNHSPGARVSQGAKNQKQALGIYSANFHSRLDMDVNVLNYPQRPIVKTVTNDIIDFDKHPMGQNIVVAVMSYKGYNMEDAIVINRGSVDRGFGRSTYFRTAQAEELKYPSGPSDEITLPDKDVVGYRSEKDYRYLEEDGVITPQVKVKEGNVVIGRTSPPRFLSNFDEYNLSEAARRESSIALNHGEEGIVDFVEITENQEGHKLVRVKIRTPMTPELGDKFISRHGQKGVIGLILPEEDVPFTESGIRPDLLFSPHSLPSRMTMAHMLEMLGGKVGALAGEFTDGTPFTGETEESLRSKLLALGFREDGTEVMYNPVNGKRYNTRIYIGNIYYLKLKHLVANKIQARARGPIQLLTRQPTEGRAKEGGLRLGEMEKDTFVAHGAALALRERFDSDKVTLPICDKCGSIGYYDKYKQKLICPICGENTTFSYVDMAYAFKLFSDELKAMYMDMNFSLKDVF